MKKLVMVLAFGLGLTSMGMARDRVEYRPARPVAVREYVAPARVVVHRERVVRRREWRRDHDGRFCWR
jgi:hypothetical protein